MFRDWVARWFFNDRKTMRLNEAICYDIGINAFYKRLAINTCINLIANSLTKANFRTFEKGKETKRNNYYLFNVEPNVNQNATEFMQQLIWNLVYENECLVIMQDDQLLVADEWTRKEFALKENIYTDIRIGDFAMNKTFVESEVLYFKLHNEKVTDLINGLYADYGKLISASMGYYKKNNALRATLNLDISRAQTDDEQEELDDLFNVQFKNFFEAEGGAVLPLQDGIELKEIFQGTSGGGSKSQNTRDIRALVDDIFDFVATAFLIPKGLIKGDLADIESQTDNYLMFCLSPIAELIEDEINRKYYSKDDYLNRTYLKVDTSMIKYVDITKLANALEKLISSGTHSPNENRALLDKEPIEEEWANRNYITKNYAEAEGYLKGGEG